LKDIFMSISFLQLLSSSGMLPISLASFANNRVRLPSAPINVGRSEKPFSYVWRLSPYFL
jgi:hypothetical protein